MCQLVSQQPNPTICREQNADLYWCEVQRVVLNRQDGIKHLIAQQGKCRRGAYKSNGTIALNPISRFHQRSTLQDNYDEL